MNKSEELCKLLGIEPTYYDTCKCGEDYMDRCTCYHVEGCGDCNQKDRKINKYPDLTKPSNFVKLLEMLITKHLFQVSLEDNEVVIEGFPYYDHKRESISDLLINGLIAFIESELEDCGNECRDLERCKTTYQEPAQQTEWEY